MAVKGSLLRGVFIALAAALAGYVTWDRVEAHRLSGDIAAIAARGEPIDLSSLEATPATAPEQEAARLYADAAARAREMVQQDGGLLRVDLDGVVGRVSVADVESTFRKDAPALQLLDRATPLPFAGFGDVVDGPEWAVSTGLQALSGLAGLRADLLAYHGDGDAAAASLAGAVRVLRTLPDAITQSFVAPRQFGSLRILLRHAAPSTAALEALQAAFAEMPDEDLIAHDLMLRRARLIESAVDASGRQDLPAVVGVALHPFLTRTQRIQIEQFPEVFRAARTPWPDKIGVLAALADSSANRNGRTSLRRTVFGPPFNIAALSAAPVQAAMRLSVRRLAVTALASERYRRAHRGAPAPDLASLVPAFLPAVPIDPFSGAPPIYRPSRSDYLLYSVDINRQDDGGQIYGIGSLNPLPYPRARDFGIRVPLTPQRGAQ